MPRREDERHLSLSGKHPVYCTCTQCTENFLRKKSFQPGRSLMQRFFGKATSEKVKAHPAGCTCATCNLLRSVDRLPPISEVKPGLLQRLLGRK